MILFFEEDPNIAAVVYQRMKKEDRDQTIWATSEEEAISTIKDYHSRLSKIYLDYPKTKPVFVHNPISSIAIADYISRSNIDLSKCEFHVITWSYLVHNTISDLLGKKGYKVYHSPFGEVI